MEFKIIRKALLLLSMSLGVLFLARTLFEYYSDKIELEYLCKSFVKLALLGVLVVFIIKNKLYDTSIFKNYVYFVGIAIVLLYFAHSSTQQSIEFNHLKVNWLLPYSFLLSCIVTGFFEESFFRILFFNAFLKSFSIVNYINIFKSYILTSLLFGLVHFVNLNSSGFLNVLNQVLLAFGLGLLLQVLLAKYNNILFIFTLHSLINYFGTRNSALFHFEETETEVFSYYEVFMNLSVFAVLDLLIILYVFYFVKGLDLEKDIF
jgi:membrane protease YdiL (CAAX protease family)